MLDKSKVMKQVQTLSEQRFVTFADDLEIMKKTWLKVQNDTDLCERFEDQSYKLVVPGWSGALGITEKINGAVEKYAVAAVDGSQIYYDKHQGIPCHVLNIGTVGLRYGYSGKAVFLDSEPHVFMSIDDAADSPSSQSYDVASRHSSLGATADETINLKRELYELRQLLEYSRTVVSEIGSADNYLAVCDGSLLFFYVDVKNKKIKTEFFDRYIDILMQMYEQKIQVVGYISFPKSKELVNVLRLVVADFDEQLALSMNVLGSIVDADIVNLFLKPGERIGLFQTRTSLVDLYPDSLKPYFCYMHVGEEIVRVEFPAWMAKDEGLVNSACARLLDQAKKGRGYPVCLFEAHEQAVIKSAERSFFYQILQNVMSLNKMKYSVSQKQLRKQKPFI